MLNIPERNFVMLRERILIVDDDPSVRRLYRSLLALSGYAVDTAEDGLGALQKISEEKPSLILLDLDMPQVNGANVLSDVRGNHETSNIPVVIVTGVEDSYDLSDASAVLRKPCDPAELISVIERHLISPA